MKRFIRYLPLLLITLLTLASHLLAQSPNRAALVVSFGDSDVVTQCVEFSEPEITGLEVLQRAGLDVSAQVQGMGAAVCSIDDTGCPSNNCFCQCSGGGTCRFWNYWHLVDGNWQFSQVGGSLYPVQDGAVEGWAWGVGASNGNGDRPPAYTFDQICAPAATAAPVPTDTPLPTETAVLPTATLAPTHTPLPTQLPDPEIDFRAAATTVVAGGCTVLRWDVEHVTAVFLNDIGVEGHGTQEVCPAQTETYTLHIVYAAGEKNRQVIVSVVAPTATAVLPTQAITQLAAPTLSTATSLPPAVTALATETAVVSSLPITATTTRAATAVPTLQATATYEIVSIVVPLMPTEAVPATAVAQLMPTPAAPTPLPTPLSASPPPAAIAPGQWLAYAIFGMIVAGLGTMLLLAKR